MRLLICSYLILAAVVFVMAFHSAHLSAFPTVARLASIVGVACAVVGLAYETKGR